MNSIGIHSLLIVITTIIISYIALNLSSLIIKYQFDKNDKRDGLTPFFACLMFFAIMFGTPLILVNRHNICESLYQNIIAPTNLADSIGTWLFLLFIVGELSAYGYLVIDSIKKKQQENKH